MFFSDERPETREQHEQNAVGEHHVVRDSAKERLFTDLQGVEEDIGAQRHQAPRHEAHAHGMNNVHESAAQLGFEGAVRGLFRHKERRVGVDAARQPPTKPVGDENHDELPQEILHRDVFEIALETGVAVLAQHGFGLHDGVGRIDGVAHGVASETF